MTPRSSIVVGSLCYIFCGQEVLLLKRAHPPYQGLWSPPGGKMKFGESPQSCCIREIREETGIALRSPELRGIQTVVDVAIPIHWQLFIYRANIDKKIDPQSHVDHHEGELRWFTFDDLTTANRPYTDQQAWAHIIREDATVWQSKFVFDTPDSLIDEQINP